MTTELWFQHGDNKMKFVVRADWKDVCDIITLIHSDNIVKAQLNIPKDCGTITLYRTYDEPAGTFIDPGTTREELIGEIGYKNSRDFPIIVRIRSSRAASDIDTGKLYLKL
jgi:hypothetical protein